MASQAVARLMRIMRNPHFWLLIAMFAILIVLHYPQQIFGATAPSSFFGLSRHTVERVLFLLPIAYAGFFFGIRGGIASLIVAFAIMLPRAIFLSPNPSDALFETCGVILIGALVNLWFESQRREKERRHQALLILEAAQQELQSNERRLAAINAISEIVSQSLEIEQVLNSALTKVTEVMGVEVASIFLVDKEAQELELKASRGASEEFIAGVRRMKMGEGFNGRVAQCGEPLLVKNVSQDPRITREVVALERLHATLIVPLKSKGEVVGTLSVSMRQPREFRPEEVELLNAIGNEIGIAIENARLYEEEKRLEENLRFYLQQVTKAQEEERKRIARELHDDTAQALVVLSRQLDSFISAQQRPIQDIVPLEKLREHIDRILEGVRRFSQDLRPSILDDLGLLPALEWLASDLTDHFGISIGVAVLGSERRFSSEAELLLFRIAQEALRNVWRHSKASRAWVTVEFEVGKTILTIRDNGKGFELPKRVSDLASTGKLGLAGMEERARLLGGSLTLQSKLGMGTTVTVEVPI
jgi:two-component system sensor histidine kinase DegS